MNKIIDDTQSRAKHDPRMLSLHVGFTPVVRFVVIFNKHSPAVSNIVINVLLKFKPFSFSFKLPVKTSQFMYD